MKMSQRLESAIGKLYNAFHNDTLNPECCKQCAVGNILDGRDFWKNLSDEHGSPQLNYVGKVNEAFGKRFNGYTPLELLTIEVAFLQGCGFSLPLNRNSQRPLDSTSKDTLFVGLSAAVSFLCNLDGVKDVMDCSELFDYKSDALRPNLMSI
ncbi:hypothetical protein SAMN03097699_1647 [Flavobacteriaceae bacterium MAR_2010_188]|nr:hypothetical protein SAMN03097699_1647 [Flavobacteriaceae bacterium MAR_2010_188]